jgi:hypothetical protein
MSVRHCRLAELAMHLRWRPSAALSSVVELAPRRPAPWSARCAAAPRSVMLLEEGGYVSAVHRMLRPWVSYVPYYRYLPQELRDVVNLLADKPALASVGSV